MPWVDTYLSYLQSVRRYSSRTCEIYSKILSDYVAFVDVPGDLPPISVALVRSYEVHLLDDCGLSARTACQHMSVLSSFCRFLIKKGVMESNPVHLVTRPKLKKKLPQFYKEDAMEDYFRTTEGDPEFGDFKRKLNRLIVSLLANTGIRRAELISLNVSSVDLSRQILRVKGKGDKMREIPLIPSLCEEISLYLKAVSSLTDDAYDPESPLLRTGKGSRLYPVFVDRVVKSELGTVPGITGRKSPHCLRHTLATELLTDGADLNSIKELLGHSSLAATQVYVHNSVERLQKVYNNAHPRAKAPQKGKNGGNHGD